MKQYVCTKKRDQLKLFFTKLLGDSFGLHRVCVILDLLSLAGCVGSVPIEYGQSRLVQKNKVISKNVFDVKAKSQKVETILFKNTLSVHLQMKLFP